MGGPPYQRRNPGGLSSLRGTQNSQRSRP